MINPAVNLERHADALLKAQKRMNEVGPEQTVAKGWTIAITREAGTPGGSIAKAVGARLGWSVYDRELIDKIASEMGLRSRVLDSVDEKRKSYLLECIEALTSSGSVPEAKFVRHLVETVLSLGALGHCVIVGRGAAHILPPENTMRVRLVGAKEDRIERTRQRLNLSAGEAAQWIEKTDWERTLFVRDHFRKDAADLTGYDLVLNTSRWSIADCAELIVQATKILETR